MHLVKGIGLMVFGKKKSARYYWMNIPYLIITWFMLHSLTVNIPRFMCLPKETFYWKVTNNSISQEMQIYLNISQLKVSNILGQNIKLSSFPMAFIFDSLLLISTTSNRSFWLLTENEIAVSSSFNAKWHFWGFEYQSGEDWQNSQHLL